MCELVIDAQLAAHLGLPEPEPERIPPDPDPPCQYCLPGATCWFHRPWLPGARREA